MDFHSILHTILINWKRIISVTILSTIILFLILLFVYPVTYKATAVLLPPEKNTSLIGLSSVLAQQNLTSLLTPSLSNASSQLYAEILKSRSAALYVIKKLDIQDEYDKDDINLAASKLSKDLDIELTKEGMIKVSVEYSSRFFPIFFDNLNNRKIFSAKLANTFVEALDKLNREKISSKSRKARIFLEGQLSTTRLTLDSLETELQNFQKKNKAISIPDQLKASIESAVKLKTEISQLEIELGLMKYNVQQDDKIYQSILKRLDQLRQQYNKIELDNNDYLIAFEKVPGLAKELANLMREVKIQNEVYVFLQQQYYKEKIEESRDLPTVEILDPAIPPHRAVSPRLFFSTILGGFFAFVLMSALFIIKQKNNKLL